MSDTHTQCMDQHVSRERLHLCVCEPAKNLWLQRVCVPVRPPAVGLPLTVRRRPGGRARVCLPSAAFLLLVLDGDLVAGWFTGPQVSLLGHEDVLWLRRQNNDLPESTFPDHPELSMRSGPHTYEAQCCRSGSFTSWNLPHPSP